MNNPLYVKRTHSVLTHIYIRPYFPLTIIYILYYNVYKEAYFRLIIYRMRPASLITIMYVKRPQFPLTKMYMKKPSFPLTITHTHIYI
jgi:hypothetical protein